MNLPQNQPSKPIYTSDPSKIESSQVPSHEERTQPIPPPSHPRQYRAIGLIRGKYQITGEQITQGNLITSDGTEIEAVLLGRVISLVKKHLDLEQEHLWVVYPRTKIKDERLHVQIVGVWEPETLSQEDEQDSNVLSSEEIQENYFSIRGEVVFFDRDKKVLVVKIKQFPRKEGDKPKSFKLKLQGVLEGKPLRRFWDLNVNLEGETLVVPPKTGTDLGFAQKKPRFKKKLDSRKPFKKRPNISKPNIGSVTPRPKPKINKPTK
ncbi:conserved hypothetical protein [Hyella patelloides LEGE 07179]|uniref:Uncharacterized protein n=1 Tax=Hyella patelloides LEGE 07179 TaxID=945734 RepID=A0A563VPI9_9CYAN|nr:hypothetical protein [Hyella patelloides]VEP13320.1 conserved hypothetical protein [Hyella patelloides LEGE 07179]